MAHARHQVQEHRDANLVQVTPSNLAEVAFDHGIGASMDEL
jgi:hypothetical protein